ncbi:flippase, partial [Enterobacter hormaechei]
EISLYREDKNENYNIISTASLFVIILCLLALIIIALSTPEIVHLLTVSPGFCEVTINSFLIVSFIIPLYLLYQVCLCSLEGLAKFANINIQRLISSNCLALLPALFCLSKPTR